MTDEELLRIALEARERAYAPYSGHKVGAALLTASGKVYTGANVENASYGLTVCAERVAVFKAVTEGEREFEKLAVVCGDPSPSLNSGSGSGSSYCRPCGACRQVLAEFAPEVRVIMGNARGEYEVKSLKELLPEAFTFKRSGP